MEKEFIPYELALKLKELGFNEKCFGVFINGVFQPRYKSINSKFNPNAKLDKRDIQFCTAPLWQQAFDWFMKQFSIRGFIENKVAGDFGFVIYIPNENNPAAKPFNRMSFYTNHYKTYEEACLECLKKLIEIIEQNDTI